MGKLKSERLDRLNTMSKGGKAVVTSMLAMPVILLALFIGGRYFQKQEEISTRRIEQVRSLVDRRFHKGEDMLDVLTDHTSVEGKASFKINEALTSNYIEADGVILRYVVVSSNDNMMSVTEIKPSRYDTWIEFDRLQESGDNNPRLQEMKDEHPFLKN